MVCKWHVKSNNGVLAREMTVRLPCHSYRIQCDRAEKLHSYVWPAVNVVGVIHWTSWNITTSFCLSFNLGDFCKKKSAAAEVDICQQLTKQFWKGSIARIKNLRSHWHWNNLEAIYNKTRMALGETMVHSRDLIWEVVLPTLVYSWAEVVMWKQHGCYKDDVIVFYCSEHLETTC